MDFELLLTMEVTDESTGEVRVELSEDLMSIPLNQQLAVLEGQLKMYETDLININNAKGRKILRQEESGKYRDADAGELHFFIALLHQIIGHLKEHGYHGLN